MDAELEGVRALPPDARADEDEQPTRRSPPESGTPHGVGWLELLGVAALAGVGFTLSIFIAGLAFAATTIADIEAAAGLSPGSGGLYRHFPSKRALLVEGVRQQIAAGAQLVAFLGDEAAFSAVPLRERLAMIARAGLRRLDQERDLNRLLVRDLARFPELLAEMRDGEIQRVYHVVTAWVVDQAGPEAPERDWAALSAVLVGAVSHYWLLRDVFGQHPAGIDEERYAAALVELAAGLLDPSENEKES